MGKTVLILGNGFDLAHGLPTRYSDFLKFCDTICEIKNSIAQEGVYKLEYYDMITRKINKRNFLTEFMFKYYETLIYKEKNFQKYGNKNFLDDIEYNQIDYVIKNIYHWVNDNIWYKYLNELFNKEKTKGEKWIDFESEISFIIETIDKYVKNISHNWYVTNDINSDVIDFPSKFTIFRSIVDVSFNKRPGTVKNIRKRLYNDLNSIISALETYLLEFAEKFIKPKKIDLIDKIEPDCIINFNYTHTYQNIYGNCEDVFHIHGELNHEPNNMVLGINEYWPKKERNKNTNFTVFKKFAQRIQKDVGIENYKWFDEILYDYKKRSEFAKVFIFGHSLDVTDKDILCDYLKSAATEVTIYCIDNETEGEYIANLIKIMGEKRLLEKINQYPQKLKFVILNKDNSIEKNEEEKALSTFVPVT